MPEGVALLLFLIAGLLAILGQAIVTRDVIVGRAPGLSAERAARRWEIVWAILPAIVLIVVLVATWHAVTVPTPVSDSAHALS